MAHRIVYTEGFADIPASEKYCCYDPATGRTLIYTDKRSVKGYKTLPAAEQLSSVERGWLAESSASAEKEYFKSHEAEIKDFMQKTLADFKKALEKESAEN
ncbi:MAG: hypothetical protein J6S14_05660 [Clostridia bacterium]|nr:hypothetical protein [Clostridia bacterium]